MKKLFEVTRPQIRRFIFAEDEEKAQEEFWDMEERYAYNNAEELKFTEIIPAIVDYPEEDEEDESLSDCPECNKAKED